MLQLLLLIVLSSPLLANPVKLSGSLEAQSRQTWNNSAAKKDLAQDWDQSNFSLLYSNIGAEYEITKRSKVEANWITRYTNSNLYNTNNSLQDNYLAAEVFTFPRVLVARNLFNLQHQKQGAQYRLESTLNKLSYELKTEDTRFRVGRIFINYGQGEIFNPLNPFNQPTALNAITNFAQGNDGANFSFFADDKHTLHFYFLGDKSLPTDDGRINKTLWIHGEYAHSDQWQFDYVLGEDQKRHKLGGQMTYLGQDAMLFAQILYQSNMNDNTPSANLWDFIVGYDEQLTSKWHIRVEGGHQKKDPFQDLTNLNGRFLPTEYFIALANKYEVHPLMNLSATLINDIKSGFTYFVGKSTYSLSSNTEAELFVFSPISKGKAVDYPLQKIVTTDVGLSLRAYF